MKISNILIGALMLAGTTFTGCTEHGGNGNDGNNPGGGGGGANLFADIVTLDYTSPGGTRVSFQRQGDSPMINLSAAVELPAELKVGSRIVIGYWPDNGERYVSGPITILQAFNTFGLGGEPRPYSAVQTNDWASEGIELLGVQRSGDYIDVVFNAKAIYSSATAELVLDRETADSEKPQYYVIFKKNTSVSTSQYSSFFLSYSIKDVWAREDVKGVTVHYTDANTGIKVSKDILKITQPSLKED